MTIEYIRYALVAHSPEELLASYAQAVKILEAAPECLGYDLAQCEEEPSSLILRIEWISTEAHLQRFRKGPHFPPFLAAIRVYVPEIAEMRHYRSTKAWPRVRP